MAPNTIRLVAIGRVTILRIAGQSPVKTHLKVGDSAPDLTLPSTFGREPVKLSGFEADGKRER